MTSLAFSVEQYAIYTGSVAVQVRPGFARLGRVELILEVDPPQSITSFDVKPSKRIGQAKRSFRVYEPGSGIYRIELGAGQPLGLDLPIFTFDWTADCRNLPTRAVTWRIVSPEIHERFGGRYVSTSRPYTYNVGKAPL